MRPAQGPVPSTLLTAAIGLVIVLGLALVARAELSLGAWYAAKAGGVFAIAMVLVVGSVRQHHPFATFGPANQVTSARAGLVALVCGLIGEPSRPPVGLAAAVVGLGTTCFDGVDGWLARRTGMASALGARFDMETDALLILALAMLAWQHEKVGPWVLASGLMRYGFIAGGWLWEWLRQPLAASARGRVICVVQIAALLLTIVPAIPPRMSSVIAAIGLGTLSYSFIVDSWWLWRHRPMSSEGALSR